MKLKHKSIQVVTFIILCAIIVDHQRLQGGDEPIPDVDNGRFTLTFELLCFPLLLLLQEENFSQYS